MITSPRLSLTLTMLSGMLLTGSMFSNENPQFNVTAYKTKKDSQSVMENLISVTGKINKAALQTANRHPFMCGFLVEALLYYKKNFAIFGPFFDAVFLYAPLIKTSTYFLLKNLGDDSIKDGSITQTL